MKVDLKLHVEMPDGRARNAPLDDLARLLRELANHCETRASRGQRVVGWTPTVTSQEQIIASVSLEVSE